MTHTREAHKGDADQLLENISWIRNAPKHTRDSIEALVDDPKNIILIHDVTKATILFQVDEQKRDVNILWWLGPPDVRFVDEKEVLGESCKLIVERWGRPALRWNIGGISPDGTLAARWQAELRGTDGRILVNIRPYLRPGSNDTMTDYLYTYAWSTVGEMAEATGVDVG